MTVIATGIVTTILTAVAMGIIQPNGLRSNVQTMQLEQVSQTKQIDSNTGSIQNHNARIYQLEIMQGTLATKEDLQTLKEDLIRELKR